MTVAELIEALKDCPGDMEVMIEDTQGDFVELDRDRIAEYGLAIQTHVGDETVRRVVIL